MTCRYNIRRLHEFGEPRQSAPNNHAPRINNHGHIAGATTIGQEHHAVILAEGHLTDLGTLGGPSSHPYAINDAGVVVGTSLVADGQHAFMWADGVMTDLDALRPEAPVRFGSYPHAINLAGQIVGTFARFGGFRYHDGVFQWLGSLGGRGNQAHGLNNAGQAVGLAFTAAHEGRAFLHDGTTMHDLGTIPLGPPATRTSFARDVNEHGWVVGDAGGRPGSRFVRHAFLHDGTVMHDLGTFHTRETYAMRINNRGQVVGYAEGGGGAVTASRAWLWQEGAMHDLTDCLPADAGWVLHYATDINDGGEIVGWGSWQGEVWPFLLLPLASAEEPHLPQPR
ncbi:MAG: hypothetical protein ACTHMU_21030 [Thermomicrobiales bacterium]